MIQPEIAFKDIIVQSERSMTWAVPSELPYFDGHFPGMPILPAVAMIDVCAYVLRQPLKSVSHARFLSPISPGMNVRIELEEVGKSDWQASWKEASSDRLLASLRVQV